MRLVSTSLRRPSGSRRTPANSSASVTDVIATSPSRDASQSTTRDSGNGRKISEITFVSRTITRIPPPRDVIAPRDRQIFDSTDILRGSQQSDSDVRPACSLGKDGANLGFHGPTVLLRLRGELLFHGVVETANDDG